MTFVQFFKARKKPPIMLHLVEKTLDQMPFLIKMFVIVSLFFAIFSGWDYRLSTFFSDFCQKVIRIIGTVRNGTFKFKARNQCFRLCDVMPLSACQDKAQRIAESIYICVDFCAEPALAAPQGLCLLPTAFF